MANPQDLNHCDHASAAAGPPEGSPSESYGRPARVSVTHDSLENLLRAVADSGEPALPRYLTRGTLVGDNFEIHRLLGVGGMGVVYLARDRRLNRAVALKIRRRGSQPGETERFLREAKAMARLSHPNVVTVYDVGPLDDDHVFIAMQYVHGQTARDWLRERPRPWREIVSVFLQAGRGLEAAHAASLVHRDFKPDNILMGGRHRVLVADFGLARSSAAPVDGPRDAISAVQEVRLPSGITRSDAVLGTPAYMSPEQHRSTRVDAAADQYAFCVALFEALYGVRPFKGETHAALLERIRNGRTEDLPRDRPVPGWLHRLVVKGLAFEPQDRHPDMAALLGHLSAGLRRRRRFGLLAAAGVAVLVVGVLFAFALPRSAPPTAAPCRNAPQLMGRVWGPTPRTRLRQAFERSKAPGARDSWKRTTQVLDRYAAAWEAAHNQACRATNVHHTQSPALLDLRMACLERRRQALQALVQVLARADRQVVHRAVHAAARLPTLQPCGDTGYLTAQTKPPADTHVAHAVALARAQLAQVLALVRTGQYTAAARLAESVLKRAKGVHYAPVLAEALLQAGVLQLALGKRLGRAEELIERAYFTARAARYDELAARAAIRLVAVTGYHLGHHQAGLLWSRHAQVELKHLAPGGSLEADLLMQMGLLYDRMGRYDDAFERYQRASAIRRRLYGPAHLEVAATLSQLGSIREAQGRRDEAIAYMRQALRIQQKTLGDRHPTLRTTHTNLGLSLSAIGRHAEAMDHQRRALAIVRQSHGEDSSDAGFTYLNLGVALYNAGEPQKALEAYQRALALVKRLLGPKHADTALCLSNLGVAYDALDRHAEAERAHRQALAIYESAFGANHQRVAMAAGNLATALSNHGRSAEALPLLQRAIAIWDRTLPGAPQVAFPLTALGEALMSLKRPREALPHLERALRLRRAKKVAANYVAETQFALARALWAAPSRPGPVRARARKRARELATQALAAQRAATPAARKKRRRIKDWLAERPARR